ncbi:DcaP family trimeric outer membrane transporter [Pseudoalteromonas ruthenica]|uniref:DcaP family trimeric outer membrane transporter n=1 Tax=Pseudoalteromonas ruthenica TaxID=151081 RepID=UPI00034716D3|nr:DcaP family trimeric outer membrane transporter [Pseudoalteromonas ruthenica]
MKFLPLNVVTAALLSALCYSANSHAQSIEQRLSALEQRLSELEKQLAAKDKKIAALEREQKRTQVVANNAKVSAIEAQQVLFNDTTRPSHRFAAPAKSIRLSDSTTTLQLGGQIWLDAIYNHGEMTNRAGFQTSSIAYDDNTTNDNTLLSAGQSKLSFRSHTPTHYGDMTTRFEFDMFDDQGNADFHLTHLWGELGNWGAGQTFSGFMDINSFPNIIDYWGPTAMVFTRQPQIRYRTEQSASGATWMVTMERSDADLAFPRDIDPTTLSFNEQNDWPDATLSYQQRFTDGYIKAALLLRSLGFETSTQEDSVTGWGINVTGNYALDKAHLLKFQFATGEGIARYINDPCCSIYSTITGGSDAGLNSNGDLQAIGISGGFVYLDKQWSERFTSSLGVSYVDVDNLATQHARAFNNSLYSTINLIWNPTMMSRLGVELQYGEVENFAGEQADNLRLQTSFGFKY